MTSAGWRAPAALAAGAALLYLAVPSARFNFDGVACAIAVELGEPRHLVHSQHLVYGLLGRAFFLLWKLLGYSGPALASLQALDSLLGAAGVAGFFVLARRAGLAAGPAAACAAGLAVSEYWWTWSTEAQVYLLGSACLAWAAAEGWREKPDPARVAVLHALAVMGHCGHVMFTPAALSLLRSPRDKKRYLAVLAGVLVVAYACAALLLFRPRSWDDLRLWLLGNAALGPGNTFMWQSQSRGFLYSWSGIKDWVRLSLSMAGAAPWAGLALWGLAALGARRSWREDRRTVRACLLWLAGYAALYLSWQPYTPVYRVSDLLAVWLLAGLGAAALPLPKGAPAAARAWALAAASAALGAWNLAYSAVPGGDPSANRPLQRALWVARATPEAAWVAADAVEQVYLPYFSARRPLNLKYHRGREHTLAERLDGLAAAGEPVFAVDAALAPEWMEWLRGYGVEPVEERGGETLYRVRALRERR